MYNEIYLLLANAFYNVSNDLTLLTGWQELTLTLLATIAVLFVFSIPFIILFWVMRRLICR